MEPASAVPLLDVVRALAFVGDLAMGQPTDHSLRTAWIAGQLATAAGGDAAACADATATALLRWSGCTANAPEFAHWFGDDVAGREGLLALPTADSGFRAGTTDVGAAFLSLSRIHCEVSGSIAGLLGLDVATQSALHHLFESHDGSGAPDGLRGDAVPRAVYFVAVAGDLEIFSRLHGLARARALIARRGDALYPRALADIAIAEAAGWLQALEDDPLLEGGCSLHEVFGDRRTSLELLATVVDLKLPWMTGHSRRVAQLARDAAARLGLDRAARDRLYRAGLIHGIGRASVPNMVWDTPGPLQTAGWERVRLAPYWTARAGRQLGSLAAEAEIASYAYERLDGSGYYREARAQGVPIEGRMLAAAAALAALRSPRPWREAFSTEAADALLRDEAAAGRFDRDVVDALAGSSRGRTTRAPAPSLPGPLTARERDVLRLISGGASNKSVAQQLSISPSTVRTHVESVFRKLACTTRAAATLKAVQSGWI